MKTIMLSLLSIPPSLPGGLWFESSGGDFLQKNIKSDNFVNLSVQMHNFYNIEFRQIKK